MKKKILVVDDDLDLLEQMTADADRSGLRGRLQPKGRRAARKRLLKMKPDLAILDLMMEEKDSGFVLSHQIKKLYPGYCR